MRRSATAYRPSSASSASAASPAPASISAEPSACSSASALAEETRAVMICPPSKATSIRTRSPSATTDHLGEDAVDGVRMEEGDLEPEEPRPRRVVDQVGAGPSQILERRVEIGDLVGHVMHPRAALRE